MNELTPRRPTVVRLSDYTPPSFLIKKVELRFELEEESAEVHALLSIERNPQAVNSERALRLDGQGLELISIALDDEPLGNERYEINEDALVIFQVPETFCLRIHTRIEPQNNTSLEGLYRSDTLFCTQCEAQGFRRMTYYLDRPDVLAPFSTTVVADAAHYPVLLSNGNLVRQGSEGNRHWVTWEDPFPKPSYLFALVAGDLACHRDRFITISGKEVRLAIYVEPHNMDQCAHAMRSLIHAMRWDEENYGLEYDLDTYMIVAVDHFNMGAMENKGLNIFNSKYVLASPETATDTDFTNIEAVIAHEYFHNWTGNRVTCRDWFQLSLKEGLTVFRDQEFSADRGSRALKRISDVRILRNMQFKEDAGPMAHPVRPHEYAEINNFYTTTVYNKGAEVIRMIHRLLGNERFQQGMKLYFARHDGCAVTTDDFVQAMQDASGVDLEQFRRWYSQAGTPVVEVEDEFHPETASFTLKLRQSCPETPESTVKLPLHIPLQIGLLSEKGEPIACIRQGDPGGVKQTEHLIELTEAEQSVTFIQVNTPAIPSVLRGFSAPVQVKISRRSGDLICLALNDTDLFNRWDAVQELSLRELNRLIVVGEQDHPKVSCADLLSVYRGLLQQIHIIDRALVAETLSLPTESYIADRYDPINVQGIHAAREHLMSTLARALAEPLWQTFTVLQTNQTYSYSADAAATRALKNICLSYLVRLEDPEPRQVCLRQVLAFNNMTDAFAALAALSFVPCAETEEALEAFAKRWDGDSLVMDKWFAIQALSGGDNSLQRVRQLMEHRAFDIKNPNRVRALLSSFFYHNPIGFHRRDGEGYRFLKEVLRELDPLNPQVAARLAGAWAQWRRFDSGRQEQMQAEMEKLQALPTLSRDMLEIISKTLSAPARSTKREGLKREEQTP